MVSGIKSIKWLLLAAVNMGYYTLAPLWDQGIDASVCFECWLLIAHRWASFHVLLSAVGRCLSQDVCHLRNRSVWNTESWAVCLNSGQYWMRLAKANVSKVSQSRFSYYPVLLLWLPSFLSQRTQSNKLPAV